MVKKLVTGTKQLILNEDNDVITITLNNPQYKNALSEELTPYLRKILNKISKENNYKILIIEGKGDSFCSGGNIKKMDIASKIVRQNDKQKIDDLYKKQLDLTHAISSLKIPTVAVVTGPAAGAGFSLALSCDIRIGNKNAFFEDTLSLLL